MKKSVLFRAPMLSQSGYGVHARQVARWLFQKEDELDIEVATELLPWGQTGWLTDTEAENKLVARCVQSVANKKPFYDVTLQLQLPNEWNPMLGKFNVGLTAGVETDRCNPAWVESVNRMNLVIVPSEFTKQTFLSSGNVRTPIEVVPECFIDECKPADTKPSIDLDLPEDFNFLIFGQVTGNNPENDRKNLAYTVRWLAECLADKPNVGVILKTNLVRNTKLDRNTCGDMFKKLVSEVKKGPFPRFHMLHGALSNQEVAGLYVHPKIKAMLTLGHSEGYGIPILEAAASGLPVIATDWSGYLDFMNHGKWIKVDCNIGPIHESRVDNQIFMQGTQWATPVEADAKKKILRFLDKPDVPKVWAKELQEKILKLYSFEAISQHYDRVLLSKLVAG